MHAGVAPRGTDWTPGGQSGLASCASISHNSAPAAAMGIGTIAPFLAAEGRVLAACVDALASFGEDARAPMLEILAPPHRRELHRGALRVLAEIVRADACKSADPWRAFSHVAR